MLVLVGARGGGGTVILALFPQGVGELSRSGRHWTREQGLRKLTVTKVPQWLHKVPILGDAGAHPRKYQQYILSSELAGVLCPAHSKC